MFRDLLNFSQWHFESQSTSFARFFNFFEYSQHERQRADKANHWWWKCWQARHWQRTGPSLLCNFWALVKCNVWDLIGVNLFCANLLASSFFHLPSMALRSVAPIRTAVRLARRVSSNRAVAWRMSRNRVQSEKSWAPLCLAALVARALHHLIPHHSIRRLKSKVALLVKFVADFTI